MTGDENSGKLSSQWRRGYLRRRCRTRHHHHHHHLRGRHGNCCWCRWRYAGDSRLTTTGDIALQATLILTIYLLNDILSAVGIVPVILTEHFSHSASQSSCMQQWRVCTFVGRFHCSVKCCFRPSVNVRSVNSAMLGPHVRRQTVLSYVLFARTQRLVCLIITKSWAPSVNHQEPWRHWVNSVKVR